MGIFDFLKNKKNKNANDGLDELVEKVNEIIKNRSTTVEDLFENKNKVINHLQDLNKKMKNMSPEEIRKMVSDELKKNK